MYSWYCTAQYFVGYKFLKGNSKKSAKFTALKIFALYGIKATYYVYLYCGGGFIVS